MPLYTASVMLEFNSASGKQPSLNDVKKQFSLNDNEIDDTFGVIPLERKTGTTYLILADEQAADRIEKAHMPGFIQNWSNPKLSPFN